MATTPKLNRAMRFLRDGIDSGRFDNAPYLPPVRSLADMAGVSPVTMHHAIGRLKGEGVLSGERGHRAKIASREPGLSDWAYRAPWPAEPFENMKTWQRIAAAVERDIVNNVYAGGTRLPFLKELSYRYGTTSRTVRKALQYLCAEHIVEPRGRGYRVPSPMKTRERTTVAILVYSRDGYLVMSEFGEEFVRAMEQRCAQAKVGLMVIGCFMDNGRIACYDRDTNRRVALGSLSGMAGCIYMISIPSAIHLRLIHEIRRIEVPLGILDEIGMWDTRSNLPSGRRLRVFRAGAPERAGEDIARFLLELGHRSVAFFSPFHKEVWSQRRYRGIARVYTTAGPPSRLHAFTSIKAFMDPGRIAEGIRRCGLDRFLDYMEHHVHPGLRYNISSLIIDRRHWELLCGLVEVQEWLKQRFEEALADPEITAWVLVNDHAASYAHDILARRNITPPQRVSLISFDDSLAALRKGITSYNFNAAAHASAMLDHLLRPFASGARAGRVKELKGSIIQRRTSERSSGNPGRNSQ